jgi:hypothetical protein
MKPLVSRLNTSTSRLTSVRRKRPCVRKSRYSSRLCNSRISLCVSLNRSRFSRNLWHHSPQRHSQFNPLKHRLLRLNLCINHSLSPSRRQLQSLHRW